MKLLCTFNLPTKNEEGCQSEGSMMAAVGHQCGCIAITRSDLVYIWGYFTCTEREMQETREYLSSQHIQEYKCWTKYNILSTD